MTGKMERWEKLTITLSHWLNWIAGVGLVGMLALTVADIVGVKLFKQPIPGAIEIVGFLGVIVVAFAIAYTQVVHGHIQVEFFVTRLPKRLQAGVTAFISFIGIVLFALLTWQSCKFGQVLQTTGEVSMTQKIPFYPFVYAMAFCSLAVCLVLLRDFIGFMMKVVGK